MYTKAKIKSKIRERAERLAGHSMAERLRRAGYRDGERRPRYGEHWVNNPTSRRMAVRLFHR